LATLAALATLAIFTKKTGRAAAQKEWHSSAQRLVGLLGAAQRFLMTRYLEQYLDLFGSFEACFRYKGAG
jgi:hypothetical protein